MKRFFKGMLAFSKGMFCYAAQVITCAVYALIIGLILTKVMDLLPPIEILRNIVGITGALSGFYGMVKVKEIVEQWLEKHLLGD